MSNQYVITQARHEYKKLVEVQIHRVIGPRGEGFGLDEGQAMSVAEVANLIACGENVYIGFADGPGIYKPGPSVHRQGVTDDLICVWEGKMNLDPFLEIPQY